MFFIGCLQETHQTSIDQRTKYAEKLSIMKDNISKKAVSDFVIEDIVEKIKTGKFEPGAKLPSEEKISDNFDISRAATREALQKLEVLGLIDIKHGKGSYVSESPNLKPIQEIVASNLLTADVGVMELLETRLYVERGTVKLAATHVSEEQIPNLQEIIHTMDQAVDTNDIATFSQGDLKFHLALSKISGNTLMQRILRTIRDLMHDQQEKLLKIDDVMDTWQQHHRKIFQAVNKRNPDLAQTRMTEHLLKVKESFESIE